MRKFHPVEWVLFSFIVAWATMRRVALVVLVEVFYLIIWAIVLGLSLLLYWACSRLLQGGS